MTDRCSSKKLVCTTTAYHAAAAADDDDDDNNDGGDDDRRGLIILTIDGVQVDFNHTVFTYTDDPVITDVQPATSFVTYVYMLLLLTSQDYICNS